jgi:hypothetical protein
VAASEYIASILAKTNYGSDFKAAAMLNTVDHLRLRSYLQARMVDWDNEHYQYQNGFLSADFFEATTTKKLQSRLLVGEQLACQKVAKNFVNMWVKF